jgi:hypothetical protein
MRKILPLLQGRFLLILEAILILAIITLHPGKANAFCGGERNPQDTFSCMREEQFRRDMENMQRRQLQEMERQTRELEDMNDQDW